MELTTKANQAFSFARGEAAERGNPSIEPAHLAVAVLADPEGLPVPMLQSLGVDPAAVRAEAQQLVAALPSASGSSVGAPQTSRGVARRTARR